MIIEAQERPRVAENVRQEATRIMLILLQESENRYDGYVATNYYCCIKRAQNKHHRVGANWREIN